jgi:DNA-binding NtrC family response regulator
MAQTSILVVDDEKLIRWSMKKKLESWNYQVFEAENLKEALRVFQQETPRFLWIAIPIAAPLRCFCGRIACAPCQEN